MSSIKKLHMYQHMTEEVLIDIYPAKEWGNFIIMQVDANDPAIQELMETVNAIVYSNEIYADKQIIIIPKDMDIEFFGVEEETDETADAN